MMFFLALTVVAINKKIRCKTIKSENGGFVALLTCVQKKMVCPERNIETDKFFNFKNTLCRKEYHIITNKSVK